MEAREDPLDDFYEVFEVIGSGQFAVVKRCRHRESKKDFAAKFIKKRRSKTSRRGAAKEDIDREIEILAKISHPNIVKLYEVYESKAHVILIMELVSGGELFDHLSARGRVSEEEAVQFLQQILHGVRNLHEMKIVHLDLKPENLMLLEAGSHQLKIIDFGLSQQLSSAHECREMLGTPEFVAPEILNYDPISLATDMWSVGVITYMLLSGCSPFLGDNRQETFSNVSLAEYDMEHEHFSGVSQLAKDFINSLLVKRPSNRATVADCLSHKWVELTQAGQTSSLSDNPSSATSITSHPAADAEQMNGYVAEEPDIVSDQHTDVNAADDDARESRDEITHCKSQLDEGTREEEHSLISTKYDNMAATEESITELDADLLHDVEIPSTEDTTCSADTNNLQDTQEIAVSSVSEDLNFNDSLPILKETDNLSDSIDEPHTRSLNGINLQKSMETVSSPLEDLQENLLNLQDTRNLQVTNNNVHGAHIYSPDTVIVQEDPVPVIDIISSNIVKVNNEIDISDKESECPDEIGEPASIKADHFAEVPSEVTTNGFHTDDHNDFKLSEQDNGDSEVPRDICDFNDANQDLPSEINGIDKTCISTEATTTDTSCAQLEAPPEDQDSPDVTESHQNDISRTRTSVEEENKSIKEVPYICAINRWKNAISIVRLCARLAKKRGSQMSYFMAGSDDNIVMTTLFSTIEEGNLEGTEKLIEEAQNFDIDQSNKHGETALHVAASGGFVEIIKYLQTKGCNLDAKDKHGDGAVYWAARQGQVEVVKYLKEEGISLNSQNKAGEAAIHVAARYGHVDVIEYLCAAGADVNLQDHLGESVLHHAAWHGLSPRTTAIICAAGCQISIKNKEEETPLHCAAARGNMECVKVLLSHGANLNVEDKRGSTPLHLGTRRGHIAIALMLVHAGCNIDALDYAQETPLHPASMEGILPIVQTLCAFGCQVDLVNKGGMSPLHLSSRSGHLEVVRCLLLSGAEPDLPNKDGISAEIMALAQGHQEIAELLTRLKPDKRETYIKQLIPRNQPLNRIKAKIFGNQGVGKTTVIDSLKCGYFGSFFRKARLTSSSSVNNGKQKTEGGASTHIPNFTVKRAAHWSLSLLSHLSNLPATHEMYRYQTMDEEESSPHSHSSDMGDDWGGGNRKAPGIAALRAPIYKGDFVITAGKGVEGNGVTTRHHSLPTQMSYDVINESYTRGIDVQQANISGAGDLSIWEFSGYEPYYMVYDHFIGDPNCIHMVVFKLSDPQDVQLSQVLFWLNFIKARVPPTEPVGQSGRPAWPPRVVMVATHADKVTCTKNNRGDLDNADANLLLSTVREKFTGDMDIANHVFVMDAHLAMSSDLKSLRLYLGDAKECVVQSLPSSNGFLDAVVSTLVTWRKAIAAFPVVSWPGFVDFVRSRVNLLASEEHLKELMCQLQLSGEVVYVETEGDEDLVVLCPQWLCGAVVGQLLSHEHIAISRPTGTFTEDDVHLMWPESDAKELLAVLEALDVCVRCETDGEVEYEFPALNFVETLHGLWDRDLHRLPNPAYGGVRIQAPRSLPSQIFHLFPRIQSQLRKDYITQAEANPDCDLYQWYHGSKYCSGHLEALVTLESGDQAIEVKCRGPEDQRTALYHFHSDICEIVFEVLEDACPGINLERHLLSPCDLKVHKKCIKAYSPKEVLGAQLDGTSAVRLDDDKSEELSALVCFGSEEVFPSLTPGTSLHVSHLSLHGRRALAGVLDPQDPMGRDWCLLAVSLGLTETLPHLDQANTKHAISKTDGILELWSRDSGATIATLIRKLQGLNRQDAVDAIYSVAPLYLSFPEGRGDGTQPPSAGSENTLSSLSR